MKKKWINLAMVGASLFTSQVMAQNKKAADKLFSDVVGTWRIQTIYDGKKDITSNDTTKVQWLEFTEDGHYKSVTGTLATDSGSYRINENHKNLYLESAVDKASDNVAEWKLDISGNNMTLYQKGTAHVQRYRYIYVKTKDRFTPQRPVKPQQ